MKTDELIAPSIELETLRPAWSKPALLDYGKVADLTQSGTLTIASELYGPTYASIL